MSLINDALKRAESEKRATQSSAPTPPLQPVESTPSHSTSPLLLGGIFLLGLGAIAIAAALWFGGRTTDVVQTAPIPEPAMVSPATSPVTPDRSAPVSTGTKPSPTTQSAPSLAASTPTTITSTPIAVASAPQQSNPKPIAATLPTPTATTTSTAPPRTTTPPATNAPQPNPIRLQSIFYRHKNPTVIINGKTLGVGDTVDGIKVDSIRRTSVEIVQNGRYRTLTLQD